MSVNKYFNVSGLNLDNTNEQTLVNDLNAECIQINGIDVKYIPRDTVKEDTLYGEDVLSSFTSIYPIEMYIENADQFAGEGDLLGKFGLIVKDEINLIVATQRFTEETGLSKPLEGDLIYFPLSKGLFEIRFVEDEEPFYPLGTTPVRKIRCELFEYSQETVSTGDNELDDIMGNYNYETVGDFNSMDDNTDIETEGDSFIDFTENNPFGNV